MRSLSAEILPERPVNSSQLILAPLHRPDRHFNISFKKMAGLNSRDSSAESMSTWWQKAVAGSSRRRLYALSVNRLLPPPSDGCCVTGATPRRFRSVEPLF